MFPSTLDPSQLELKSSTSDVIPRRKKVTQFKLGKLWVFKQFFDNKETFKVLPENYNEDKLGFKFKTFREEQGHQDLGSRRL